MSKNLKKAPMCPSDVPGGSKKCPREPKVTLTGVQKVSKGAQKGPRGSFSGPQGSFKGVPGEPKRCPWDSKWCPREPQGA